MSASQGEGVGASPGGRWRRRLVLCCVLLPVLVGLLLAACARGQGTPSAPTPTAAPGREPGAADSPVARPELLPTATLTITVWGPELMAPLDQVAGGSVLAGQLRAFSDARPGWQVDYVRKKAYGPGGLVHFLRATHAVAPERMPDLVLLDMRELGLLADDHLLQPVEPLLGPEATADLAPFARAAGTVGDHLLAAQYAADLCFLAQRRSRRSTAAANAPAPRRKTRGRWPDRGGYRRPHTRGRSRTSVQAGSVFLSSLSPFDGHAVVAYVLRVACSVDRVLCPLPVVCGRSWPAGNGQLTTDHGQRKTEHATRYTSSSSIASHSNPYSISAPPRPRTCALRSIHVQRSRSMSQNCRRRWA